MKIEVSPPVAPIFTITATERELRYIKDVIGRVPTIAEPGFNSYNDVYHPISLALGRS